MQQQWKTLFTLHNFTQACIIKGLLEKNSIPTQVLNQQDSSFLAFGSISVMVPEKYYTQALLVTNHFSQPFSLN